MNKARVVHLLDDFGLGGGTRGLRVFEDAAITNCAESSVHPIKPKAFMAPQLNADIIMIHFPPNWRRLSFFLSLRARNRHAKIVHVEHSYSQEWEALHVPEVTRFRLMFKLAMALVDHVICVSKAQARWMLKIKIVRPDKLDVIHPFTPNPELSMLPLPRYSADQTLVIGAFGRFHEAKGFDRLIEAFKQSDQAGNMKLRLGGFGPEEAALKAQAAGFNRIRFVGEVKDVAAFIGSCDVIVIPSRYETFGQVATEARMGGRPILVSTAGGLPEQAGKSGIIVDCTDPAALIKGIQGLRNLPLAAMAQSARASTATAGDDRIGQWVTLIERLRPHQVRGAGQRKAIPISTIAGQVR